MPLTPDVLSPASWEFWSRVLTAVTVGGAIGLERQRRGKVAGIRTSILICLGTNLFVSLGAIAGDHPLDPTRVLGQVVSGIGFLGAGVILSRGGRVLGVTTAAVIWLLAAVGAMIGFGYLQAALVIAGVTLLILNGVEWLDRVTEAKDGKRGSGMFDVPSSD
ncbi:MAG TPA: MgtC/SapB family protein [Gemmatimonadales bacterium]|nr:MgtC/SapB family protein [Gemmatimonadales bacterium]